MNLACRCVLILLVALLTAPAYGALLFDVNNGTNATGNTQAGWMAAIPANGVTFASVAPTSLASRDRNTGNTNGSGGDVANNDMWRDFIFANGSSVSNGGGMDISISGLMANTVYGVRLWGWDDSSNGGRSALWNGSNVLAFPNGPDPMSLDDYVVSFQATADSLGILVLQGRVDPNGDDDHNVFVNGFELTAIPEPATIAVWGLLGLCWAGLSTWRRRRNGLVELTETRTSWSEQNRVAIRQMLDNHLAK